MEENTTRTITFEVLNTCPDLDDVTVVVSWWNGSVSRWERSVSSKPGAEEYQLYMCEI